MVFSSLPFLLIFLPAVLLIDRLLPAKAKNVFLLIANLFFYAYGEPVYVLLMIGSIVVNFSSGILIGRTRGKGVKRFLLIVTLVLNLGALGVFKYTPLVFDTLRNLSLFESLPFVEIALPIGISFYTFQAMSYIIDVYRGDVPASGNFVNFAAYISLFPQLIAGPIVRYSDVYAELESRRETLSDFALGVRWFVIGLAKKVLLANQLGRFWDIASADPAGMGAPALWLGAVCYALQIYFDFCGYSEMAQGLGKMLGFDFCVNFNYPYVAKSVSEFWRRWHISLSSWFRDYVYIPLGGNRRGIKRQCVNLLIVWALTGLWHGAAWNFLLWGVYYGILIVAEKLFMGKLLKKLPAVIGHIYTLLAVLLGFVIFANENASDALFYISKMFTPSQSAASTVLPWVFTILLGAFCAMPLGKRMWEKVKDLRFMPFLEAAAALCLLVLSTAQLVSESYNPFLYFRF